MTEYQALVAYLGVTLIVFIGALLWQRYRRSVKRRLNIKGYRDYDSSADEEHHTHAGAAKGHIS